MDSGSQSYRRFLAGDDSGLAEIIRDYGDGLILYLNSIVNRLSEAELLAEDTFVRLAVKKPRDNGKGSFRTWLYAIGRNIAIDHLRKQRRQKTVPLEDAEQWQYEQQALEEAYIREEGRIRVHRAMEALKPEYRQVLWLVYFEGFSCREAAGIMGKSVHGAETLAYRARLALKALLEQEGFDGLS